jgi:peptidoglycan/LPS O-acetylase OafA/YrhL
MLSSIWGDSARAHEKDQSDLLPQSEDRARDGKASASASSNRDKIRCLDGLRGIACLIVFNYHFLWPWTPTIMLGYGALPPRSPEPSWEWPSLPIICLLHRGRPMVAIFFAISGYVLCRHILRSIHERRLDAVYQKLASAVFRRVFRLYIPPTISMFLVAMLAQMGAFRSEFAIYKGPDSVYINATVSKVQLNSTCGNWSFPVSGAAGMADYLGLQSPMYLNNITDWNNTLCLNVTSRLFGPSSLYLLEEKPKVKSNDTLTNATTPKVKMEPREKKQKKKALLHSSPLLETANATNVTESFNLTWVQLGGSWEEHPFIHDNMTYALKNFTRAYAEWANPFNFGHYHPRYDPHTFTIPMELRGSMFVYLFLLGTAALKYKWRLRMAGFLSAYSLTLGRWDMATFLGGTVLSEMDIRSSDTGDRSLMPPVPGAMKSRQPSRRREKMLRFIGFFVALYFLSYPDAGAEWTPGFVFLSSLVPKYYIPLSGWMFYQAMGALILLPCILRTPSIRALLEGRTAQYLGKISFSLYLVHGPILHSLGFWIMPRLFERLGRTSAFVVGWIMLLSVTLYLADWWYRKVDLWSTTVGKRIERHMTEEK